MNAVIASLTIADVARRRACDVRGQVVRVPSEQGTINLTASPNNGAEGYDAVVDVGTSNSSSERKATGTLSSQPPKEMTCNFVRVPASHQAGRLSKISRLLDFGTAK